jgi:hypothetical protein
MSKFIGVKLSHGRSTYPHDPGRHEEQIRVFGLCRERRVGIFQHEFGIGVLLPGSSITCWSGVTFSPEVLSLTEGIGQCA